MSFCSIKDDSRFKYFLTRQERTAYLKLGCRMRKLEWLSARIALKRILLEQKVIESFTQCEIYKDSLGRPYISLKKKKKPLSLDCSISHKSGYSLAAITLTPYVRLGVDIELISSKLYRLRETFINESDSITDKVTGDVFYTILWSCKEAASKVIGLGMSADFKSMVVRENKGTVRIFQKERYPIEGKYFFWKNLVVSILYCPAG